MATRDGIRLDADVYYPDAPGEFPVLLMRQPYGRAIASTVVYAHPIWYAAHGYLVVIQDVRGRGTSAGEFKLFAREAADGFDSVIWAANLPQSNGKVGMYGFSYQGMTQLYAASALPEPLKTICPAMVGSDLYEDWAYEGRAFCLQANLTWALQIAAETVRRQGDETAYRELMQVYHHLPLRDRIPASPDILQQLAPDSFYHEWLKPPYPDAYWQQLSPQMQAVDLPMLHIGGWFDPYLRGTFRFYEDMANQSEYRQQLIVGPWTHLPWNRVAGSRNFSPEAASPVDRLQIRWFDCFLKDLDSTIFQEPEITLFEMGSNRWRNFKTWNEGDVKAWWFSSTGLAAIREDNGKMVDKLAPSSADILVHDPWRPVPALGGHASFPAGSFERSAIDCRTDVLTYTSPPLETGLHLAGECRAFIWYETDSASFDLCAILSEVEPDGSVRNLTQGYLRVVSKDSKIPIQIVLQPTCLYIPRGSALRLSLSGACFPAYPVNPGTGQFPAEARLIDARVITIKISCGGDRPSCLALPVVEEHNF